MLLKLCYLRIVTLKNSDNDRFQPLQSTYYLQSRLYILENKSQLIHPKITRVLPECRSFRCSEKKQKK